MTNRVTQLDADILQFSLSSSHGLPYSLMEMQDSVTRWCDIKYFMTKRVTHLHTDILLLSLSTSYGLAYSLKEIYTVIVWQTCETYVTKQKKDRVK